MSTIEFGAQSILTIVNAIPIGVLLVDHDHIIDFSNYKMENLLKYDDNELIGRNIHELIPARFVEQHNILSDDYFRNPVPRPMNSGRVLPILEKNGKEIMIQIGLSPLEVNQKKYILVSMIEVRNDVLKVASFNDPLTGLANRALFQEVSENLNTLAIRNAENIALIYLDVDNFKGVNDQFGHDTGDLVLCEVASICKNSVRKNDIVGRMGGDEFVICMYGVKDYIHLQEIAQKIVRVISSVKEVDRQMIDVGASIGAIFVSSPVHIVIEELIHSADKLMYKAKKAGKGTVFTEKW